MSLDMWMCKEQVDGEVRPLCPHPTNLGSNPRIPLTQLSQILGLSSTDGWDELGSLVSSVLPSWNIPAIPS